MPAGCFTDGNNGDAPLLSKTGARMGKIVANSLMF
jgi:hypothetical protein